MTRGIDVSKWQGSIDWAKVAADPDPPVFVMAKATQGTTGVDKRWQANRAGATSAGIPIGAYQFATPGASSAAASAAHHLRHAHPAAGELVPALDMESTTLSKRDTARWALEWLAIVEEAIGAPPVVYTSRSWVDAHMHPDPALARYPLWVARYSSTLGRLPAPWTDWLWWQHSDHGRVAGIATNVDQNRLAHDRLPIVGGTTTPTPHTEEDALMAVTEDQFDHLTEKVEQTALVVTALQKELLGATDGKGRTRADRMAEVPDRLDRIEKALAALKA